MFDWAALADVISQLSPFTIGVLIAIWSMRYAKSAQKDANDIVKAEKVQNTEIQEKVLNVLNNQMAAESKRDEREVAQLEETKRSNRVMESNLLAITKLIEKIAMDNIEIKQVVGDIYANQEVIKQGVQEMNSSELPKAWQEIRDLLKEINQKLDKVLTTAPATEIPADQEGTPTRKLIPPTAFPAEDNIEVVEVEAIKDDTEVDNSISK